MKKSVLFICGVFALIAATYNLFSTEYLFLYDGNVISYAIGDANNDGVEDLLLLTRAFIQKDGVNGEPYGDYLYQLSYDGSVTGIKKVVRRFNLSDIKPMKVMLGDVDGDGLKDVSVMVYKRTEFHDIMAKRPFFYNIKNGQLNPLWRGSRLSRPFTDYVLFDIDNDGVCEIISAEILSDGKMAVAAYGWLSFGFEMLAESAEYEIISDIKIMDNGKLGIKTDKENVIELFYSDDKLIEGCDKYEKN